MEFLFYPFLITDLMEACCFFQINLLGKDLLDVLRKVLSVSRKTPQEGKRERLTRRRELLTKIAPNICLYPLISRGTMLTIGTILFGSCVFTNNFWRKTGDKFLLKGIMCFASFPWICWFSSNSCLHDICHYILLSLSAWLSKVIMSSNRF